VPQPQRALLLFRKTRPGAGIPAQARMTRFPALTGLNTLYLRAAVAAVIAALTAFLYFDRTNSGDG
jgi:hypothetical protein